MLTPTETAQARTLGIRLRLVKAAAGGESGAQGLLATSWDRGKDVLNGIGAGQPGCREGGRTDHGHILARALDTISRHGDICLRVRRAIDRSL